MAGLDVSIHFPALTSDPFPDAVVHRVVFDDALGEPFSLVLTLTSTDPLVDAYEVGGRDVTVRLPHEPHLTEVVGIVRAMRQLSHTPDAGGASGSLYEVTVCPPAWLLTRRSDARVFHDVSALDVAVEVIAAFGGRVAPPSVALRGQLPKHEYRVQYHEADWAFLRRLLVEDGLVPFFDLLHGGSFTVTDDTSTLAPSLPEPVPFASPSTLAAERPHLWSLVPSHAIETSCVSHRDYDFRNPALSRSIPSGLEGVAKATGPLFEREVDLERYSYEPGRFRDPRAAFEAASRVLAGLRGAARARSLRSTFALPAGARFSVENHPRAEENQELLVTRARTLLDDGTGLGGHAALDERSVGPRRPSPGPATASHELECVGAREPFHLDPSPKPCIAGAQSALVVGALGEGEVDVDAHGRVAIALPWDRRANPPTRRVRVSQAWAGQGHGLVTLPRIGDEVLVAYLDGDPDEPIVVGRVHNALQVSPLALPSPDKTVAVWRTRSFGGSDGFHEIRLDDAAGRERFEVRAERYYKRDVEGSADLLVSGDVHERVGGSHESAVAGQVALSSSSALVRTGGIDVMGANLTLTIEGSAGCSADRFVIGGDTEVMLTCGGSSITLTPGGITISSAAVTIQGTWISLETGGPSARESGGA
jgi:type VI secretion system secreted protein VgrG